MEYLGCYADNNVCLLRVIQRRKPQAIAPPDKKDPLKLFLLNCPNGAHANRKEFEIWCTLNGHVEISKGFYRIGKA